jgi:type IV secretory pathway VirB3-like protein
MQIKIDKFLSKPVIIFGLQVADYIVILTVFLVINSFANILYALVVSVLMGIVFYIVNATGKPAFLLSLVVFFKTPKKLTVFKAKPQPHPIEPIKDLHE